MINPVPAIGHADTATIAFQFHIGMINPPPQFTFILPSK